MKIELIEKELELRVNWKLSRNETTVKNNFFIIIENEFIGEIAPNIRYGEKVATIKENFNLLMKEDITLKDLKVIWSKNDYCHSFKFGVESALVAFEADKNKQSISNYLKINDPLENIPTSFSIPIMEEQMLEDYIAKIERFPFIKIKVNKNNAISFVNSIAKYTDKPLRVDGNEAWENLEEYLIFENEIKDLNIQFIEQPFPASSSEEYIKLKPISKFEIMGDESIEENADFEKLSLQFHSVNIKLMKASGYYNAIKLLKEAKKYKLKTMIGCMIETSIGISSAIQLSSLADYFDLDGSLLLKSDPYNKIFEKNGKLSLAD
jgi:L-alanine-DL-glutamate epimerase-like enolase superfamily enzyme